MVHEGTMRILLKVQALRMWEKHDVALWMNGWTKDEFEVEWVERRILMVPAIVRDLVKKQGTVFRESVFTDVSCSPQDLLLEFLTKRNDSITDT